jgi:hypothetical protein
MHAPRGWQTLKAPFRTLDLPARGLKDLRYEFARGFRLFCGACAHGSQDQQNDN